MWINVTAEAFRKAGGVKADFIIKSVTNGLVEGSESGTIQLKGEITFIVTHGGEEAVSHPCA